MQGLEKIIYAICGSIFTILINEFIKFFKAKEDLKKQNQILLSFIDKIILKYLELNIQEYNNLLSEVKNDKSLFDERIMYESPMLNKNIFDFFERKDLIKIFNYCKKNSIIEVYHNFYEIDFLQSNSPSILLDNFIKTINEHFESFKKENQTFSEHNKTCSFYEQQKNYFISTINIHLNHTENLITSFKQIREELIVIEELNFEN